MRPAHTSGSQATSKQAMWPHSPGTYGLVLHLAAPIVVRIGRLGVWTLPPGWYVYVGSALGSGGLRGRLARHFRTQKELRWHVDYVLAANSQVAEVWYVASSARWECAWARELATMPGAQVPVTRFGASDCRCPSHLFTFDAPPSFEALVQRLNKLGCAEVVRFRGMLNLPR